MSMPETETEQKRIGDYFVDRTLGEGTFGKVRLGIHVETKKKVALKIIRVRNEAEARDLKYIEREQRIMKLLQHEHIVQLLDVIPMPEKKSTCLVLEYVAGGELFDYIVASGKLKEKEAIRFFRQIASAMEYMHTNLVVHRDLKPENLLLDKNKNIKINDFGLSNIITLDDFLDSHCGSPHYSPPEIIQEKNYIGPEVDMWALGVLLYAMVTGCLPWSGDSVKQQIDNVVIGRYKVPKFVSEQCTNLIERMLQVDPKKRATINEVLNHPWLSVGYAKPPTSAVATRDPISAPLNPVVMSKLKDFGFEGEQVERDLLENNNAKQVVMLYHLISESGRRRSNSVLAPPNVESPTSPGSPKSTSNGEHTAQDRPFNRDIVNQQVEARVHRHSWAPGPSPDLLADVVPPHSPQFTSSVSPPAPTASPSTTSERRSRLFQMVKKSFRISMEGKVNEADDKDKSEKNPDKNLRVIDGAFNVSTTTTKDTADVKREIERVLALLDVTYKINKKTNGYDCKYRSKNLKFSIEICLIKKLPGLRGLKFNRTKGNVFDFKEVYSRICAELNL